jgi:Na+:H+ antiporter, NhaA family
MSIAARESVSPAEHLEELLHPATSFVVLPGSGATRVAIGVFVGLIAGKLLGILGGAWLGTRLRLALLPSDTGWIHLAGAAALGGIGFTVSLFITGLAFERAELRDAAKLGVLAASVAASLIGVGILLAARNHSGHIDE